MAKLTFEAGTRFGINKAHSLAKASLLTYEKPKDIKKKVLRVWKYDDFQFFNHDATQGYVMADSKRIVIAFRGTELNLRDWLTDLDLDLVAGPFEGQVHHGFNRALDAVWTRVERTIGRFLPSQTEP